MKKYIEQIKNAKTKEELKQISYDFMKNEPYKIMSKESNLIDGLCIYKECLLNNADKNKLNQCIKVLKLPKNLIKEIA